jgi:hypothetical protein
MFFVSVGTDVAARATKKFILLSDHVDSTLFDRIPDMTSLVCLHGWVEHFKRGYKNEL